MGHGLFEMFEIFEMLEMFESTGTKTFDSDVSCLYRDVSC
jgi:hypothetical protein